MEIEELAELILIKVRENDDDDICLDEIMDLLTDFKNQIIDENTY